MGEARALGLFGAIELVTDKATRTASQRRNFEPRGSAGMICRDRCVRNGLIMRAVWDTMIVAPPLIISHAQIDELLDKVRRSLDQTHAALYS